MKFKTIWSGHFNNVSISDTIKYKLPLYEIDHFAMLSCIDSNNFVSLMIDVIDLLNEKTQYWIINESIVIKSSELLLNSNIESIFTGFDELWLFDSFPDQLPPLTFSITSERSIVDVSDTFVTGILEATEIWMQKSGAIFGLGDGVGLNYVSNNLDYIQKLHSWALEVDLKTRTKIF